MLTVTVTASEPVQPEAVCVLVTVYVVVELGFALVVAAVELVSPVVGDHA